jgi:hypothetical protein
MDLMNYILTAMVSWVPVADHGYYEKQEETMVRYTDIATTIVDVAMDPENEPLFSGEDGRVKTALLMASVASSEGFFRKDVDTCKIGGDNGRAWGLWQTHAPKKKVCADRKVAATVALEMMKQSFTACKSLPLVDRMSVYTDGQCRTNWKRSRFKMDRAMKWFATHEYKEDTTELKN